MQTFFSKAFIRHSNLLFLSTAAAVLYQAGLYAQTADGNNGISQANTMVRSYFDMATQLMYAIGAIVGLIGAIMVVLKTYRNQQLGSEIGIWFACCIFLVVVATVLKSFFGL